MDTPPPPVRSLLGRIFSVARAVLVTLFVVWNLIFLFFRNPVAIWWKDEYEEHVKSRRWWAGVEPTFNRVYDLTYYYGTSGGIVQGWEMFTPNMARSAPFLCARLDFDDGSDDLVYSENEFDFAKPYARFGGWRQRKLEDILVFRDRDRLVGRDADERSLSEAYVRDAVRRWQKAHADDPRTIKAVALLRRDIVFPGPDEPKRQFNDPADGKTWVLATFDPDGKMR